MFPITSGHKNNLEIEYGPPPSSFIFDLKMYMGNI